MKPERVRSEHVCSRWDFNMATWKSRGLRGSTFEELINATNDHYRKTGLGLVQKIPTPITPIHFDPARKLITEAYFEKDSTVDYIGVVQGVPVCFDAKECKTDTFALQNIHEHQFNFMKEFEAQGGVSFLLVMFTTRNDFYYMPFKELETYVRRVDDDFFLNSKGAAIVNYLQGLALDLDRRDD